MRALAEFIMRGRAQAALVAFLGSGLPLISPATVALVTLRRGPNEGTLVLVWALLPMVIMLVLGQLGLSLVLASLVVVYAAAVLLRNTISWATTILGLVAISIGLALSLMLIAPDSIGNLTGLFNKLLEQVQTQSADGQILQPIGQVFVVGMIAYAVVLNGLLGLLLARWWQALLYNPGGFQAEFHQLRIQKVPAIVCLAATLYCFTQGTDYLAWINVFALPLLITGIALVHSVVKTRKLETYWLVLFYAALLLFSHIVVLALAIVALADSWLDFRGKLVPKP